MQCFDVRSSQICVWLLILDSWVEDLSLNTLRNCFISVLLPAHVIISTQNGRRWSGWSLWTSSSMHIVLSLNLKWRSRLWNSTLLIILLLSLVNMAWWLAFVISFSIIFGSVTIFAYWSWSGLVMMMKMRLGIPTRRWYLKLRIINKLLVGGSFLHSIEITMSIFRSSIRRIAFMHTIAACFPLWLVLLRWQLLYRFFPVTNHVLLICYRIINCHILWVTLKFLIFMRIIHVYPTCLYNSLTAHFINNYILLFLLLLRKRNVHLLTSWGCCQCIDLTWLLRNWLRYLWLVLGHVNRTLRCLDNIALRKRVIICYLIGRLWVMLMRRWLICINDLFLRSLWDNLRILMLIASYLMSMMIFSLALHNNLRLWRLRHVGLTWLGYIYSLLDWLMILRVSLWSSLLNKLCISVWCRLNIHNLMLLGLLAPW